MHAHGMLMLYVPSSTANKGGICRNFGGAAPTCDCNWGWVCQAFGRGLEQILKLCLKCIFVQTVTRWMATVVNADVTGTMQASGSFHW